MPTQRHRGYCFDPCLAVNAVLCSNIHNLGFLCIKDLFCAFQSIMSLFFRSCTLCCSSRWVSAVKGLSHKCAKSSRTVPVYKLHLWWCTECMIASQRLFHQNFHSPMGPRHAHNHCVELAEKAVAAYSWRNNGVRDAVRYLKDPTEAQLHTHNFP